MGSSISFSRDGSGRDVELKQDGSLAVDVPVGQKLGAT
jgi:hypothetical protein